MEYDINNILIVDIETVATSQEYFGLNERLQKEWDRKSANFKNADIKSSAELFAERAGIFAEFGKIVVIAVGLFTKPKNDKSFGLRVKSFSGNDEKKLLTDFKELIDTKFDPLDLRLCGHNSKEFDFPFICRRMVVNGIKLPDILDTSTKKPWEVAHLDTMEMWKYGDRKNFTSLDLLAALFDITTSKGDMDGSMVNQVYYEDQGAGLQKINEYCMRDVAVTAQVFLKLNNINGFDEANVQYVN